MDGWTCADICDQMGNQVSYCSEFPFRHFSMQTSFWGQIETVRCFEDNSRVKEVLSQPGTKRVLVVDGRASLSRALLGDIIAQSAQNNQWAGVVINGVIRDSQVIARMTNLGVIALGTNPRKSDRKGAGSVGEAVEFTGLRFEPGHFIYVDPDGIIVSKKSVLPNICS